MKLVLYSGGTLRDNRALDAELLRLLAARKNPRITFIPAERDEADEDFEILREHFGRFGVREVECLLLDSRCTPARIERALSGEGIYLGGGNTFSFLQSLRETKLLSKLRRYAKDGGVLMGVSAGAILMTPTIEMAMVPSFESDSNEVGVRDFRALGLVSFEFSPHYETRKRGDAELRARSQEVSHPIYACRDGTGIVVEGEKISFIGPVEIFLRGEKYSLQ